MLFNSAQFLVFFPVVVLAYYAIPKRVRYLWLLAASYFFYMCWNAKYALLLLFSTAVTWLGGVLLEWVKDRSMGEAARTRAKKWVVAGSFCLNLAVLFYFKYCNFALQTLAALSRLLRVDLTPPAVDVLLPVGISFYIFQALGYTVDVYRGTVRAEKNLLRYALFVSFFPQLVAGPIERSKNLLGQLADPKPFDFDAARDGLLLMLWGYFLKIVLADRIALFVDTAYGDPAAYGGFYLVVATVLFAVQIYCDFYGYSVIAMGAAEILGIRLMENFNAPYLSTSVAEFWKNWHISLTSWFRDYLYIPLGGSRCGRWRARANRMIVFLVSGLWHGADLSYVVWGGLNGLYQVLGELLAPLRTAVLRALKIDRRSLGHRMLCCATTFALVDGALIFFRAGSLANAVFILQRMAGEWNPWVLADGSLYGCGLDRPGFALMLLCCAVLLFADVCKRRNICLRKRVAAQSYWFRCLFWVGSITFVLVFGIWGPGYSTASFIYFQF